VCWQVHYLHSEQVTGNFFLAYRRQCCLIRGGLKLGCKLLTIPLVTLLGSFYFIFNAFTISCSILSTALMYAHGRQEEAVAFHALHLVPVLAAPRVSKAGILNGVVQNVLPVICL
jgi:hypothetical protein